MLNNSLKIHPRGFYGSSNAGLMSRVTPPDYMVGRPLESNRVEHFIANKNVEDLFNLYSSGKFRLSDFDQCKDAIVTILNAFGQKQFEAWHSVQYDSPFFGDLHVDFIEDWCKYMCTGSRDIDLYTWGAMLDRNSQKADRKKPLKKYTSEFFGKKNVFPFSGQRITTLQMITNMLQKPQGFDSLILTAHILFCIKY